MHSRVLNLSMAVSEDDGYIAFFLGVGGFIYLLARESLIGSVIHDDCMELWFVYTLKEVPE